MIPTEKRPPRVSASEPLGELLFIAHRLPYPPNKGDKIRSFNELTYLVSRGWRVHLCTLADDPGDLEHMTELKKYCASVAVELIRPRLQRLASARGPLRGAPLSVPYFYSAKLQRRVDDLLNTRPIQAVVCFSGPMAEYVFRSERGLFDRLGSQDSGRLGGQTKARASQLPSFPVSCPPGVQVSPPPRLPASPRPRLVMDLVDVDSDKWTQYSRFQRWPLSWVHRLEGNLLARYEARVAELFDAVALVSPAEVALFGRRCGFPHKVHAVGNGVDLDYFHPAPPPPVVPASPRPRLVFCGAMDYFPNVDAVVWFAREVLPRVREASGPVEFTVVGAKPAAEVLALAQLPGVTVTGRVEDVRPYVWGAEVSVAPLRVSRGVQNKVLEAMAMGKAVAASPEAFEGIAARPGQDLVVAEATPALFSAAVSALLEDAVRADKLGKKARLAMEGMYRWDAQLSALERLLLPAPTRGEDE